MARSVSGAAALAGLALLAVARASTGAQPVPPALGYEEAIRRYAAGEREAATAAACSWGEARVRAESTALAGVWRDARACGACAAAFRWREVPVRAALMLHSDCAERARGDGRRPQLHESVAVELARMLTDDAHSSGASAAGAEFTRRWYAALAAQAMAQDRWGDALDWAERGRREFPQAAEVLLVLGALEELVGEQAERRLPAPLLVANPRETRDNLALQHEARAQLLRARRALSAAVAADPRLAEGHLRLGRVSWRLGDEPAARAALERALALEPDPDVTLLARLFRGRLDEDAGRLDEAARWYQAALELDPRGQAARLALAHLRLRRGDAAGARAEVETALASAGRRPRPDPFWRYPFGPLWDAEARLAALRDEATW